MQEYDKDRHIEVLVATNEALAMHVSKLNKRKMARNDAAANSWRRKAFYWKSKYLALIELIEKRSLNTGGESL